MNDRPPPTLLADIVAYIGRYLGLHFPPAREEDLMRGLRASVIEFGFTDLTACLRWLLDTPLSREQLEVLAGNLTVGETYFHRDPRLFRALETHLFPNLLAQRAAERRLRIWSAACCTGEEPYSIAIALRQAVPDLARWQVSLLGTDVNPRFLQKAAVGIYGAWSFRDGGAAVRDRWFTPAGHGRWAIDPQLRASVTFAPLNLVEDVYPSLRTNTNALDLIVCRNVLIYFSPEQGERVVRQLALCLNEGGWLVLGPADIPPTLPPELVREVHDGLIFFRRSTPAPGASRPPVFISETATPFPTESATPPIAPPAPASPAAPLPSGIRPAAPALPEQTPAHDALLLVRALANRELHDEALAACDTLLAADKTNALNHYVRACLLREQARFAEATEALRRAVYLEPGFVLAHFALGNAAREQGRPADAARHFDNARDLLHQLPPDAPVPEADGLTAGRLAEIIGSLRAISTP